ncbi:MAG: putative ABC transporter periplasmic-binding protein [Methanosaeta sp. PtaU1.Bin112]|nr:MAG: putative ABC transporter periplasmic-binding protein [Methanosaeta sp. PtaU1.Bin112]
MIPNIRTTAARFAARFAALLVLAALLCAGVQAVVAAENTMTIGIGDYLGNETDFTIYGNNYRHYQQFTHWEPLITLDNRSNIIPWMAESYEVSDDLKAITFHLRKGIKFADGESLNASVLKFNFDRILTYGFANAYGKNGTKLPICIYYDHSEAVDEDTFKIYFTQGWLDMPKDIASNKNYGKFMHPADVDPAWNIRGVLKPDKMYNGLGAYYVDENESILDQKIVLKRRHSWRDDYDFHKPNLDKIVFELIMDPQVAVMALENGDIDYYCRYWNIPIDSLPALEKNSMISIKTAPDSRMYFIQTAYGKEPFLGEDGILLRKAICYALNRTEMVKGAFYGYARPATDAMYLSPLRPDSPECCHMGYDYDLDKAKKLLAEAGWNDTDGDGIQDKNGKSLKDLDFVITSNSALGWQKDLALVVQSQLKKIGIDVKLRMVEYADYSNVRNSGDFDLIMSYNSGNVYSSVTVFDSLFNRKGWWTETPNSATPMNYYSNQNKTLAAFIEAAKMADSIDEQKENLCQACNILYEEAGIIPLVYEGQYAVMNSKVKGFHFGTSTNVEEQDHVEECWID